MTTHGGKHTPLYNIWCGIKERCHNPKAPGYVHYGARGIVVCARWRNDFAAFLADMSPRPPGLTLERKDNNGPYSPENCVWATRKVQARNTRRNRYYEWRGESLTLAAWSERVGIPTSALYYRINAAKWPVERALTTPSVVGGNKPAGITCLTP